MEYEPQETNNRPVEATVLGAVLGLALARALTASSGELSLAVALALMAVGSSIMLLWFSFRQTLAALLVE